MRKSLLPLAVGAALAACFGLYAYAQTTIPSASASLPLGQSDLMPYAQFGVGQAPTKFVNPGTVGGMRELQLATPLTGFSITISNGTTQVVLTPAGTLATGTLVFPAVPSDGQQVCVFDTQTQTAITLTATTGTSFAGITNPTGLTANTLYCWLFSATKADWFRIL